MICTLCERPFSVEEISEAVPIPSLGGTLMFRFKNAQVHQFRARDREPQKLKGAFVLPPKPPASVEQVIEVVEPMKIYHEEEKL